MPFIKSILSKFSQFRNPKKYWSSKGLTIGQNCEVHPTANFGSEPYLIILGNHVRINAGVQFITHDGGVWVVRGLNENLSDIDLFKKISVGNNVHIGTNSIIMPGVNIGNNCIIGCGAIVTKNIPDNSVAVGIPARVIETTDEYIEKNKDKFIHTKNLNSTDKKEAVLKYFEDSI